MLTIVLIMASSTQFFLSFIKGKANKKDYGEVIFRLSILSIKQKFLAMLFAGLLAYSIYVVITGYFSTLGVMIIIYFLLSIYDFSKLKIITTKGIGQKSLYNNAYYNFSYWSDIVEWSWSEHKKNLLLFKIRKGDKIQTKDWEISFVEKEKINELFQQHLDK